MTYDPVFTTEPGWRIVYAPPPLTPEQLLQQARETLIGVATFAARVLTETDGLWPPAARAAETRRGLQHIEAECRRVHAATTSHEEASS